MSSAFQKTEKILYIYPDLVGCENEFIHKLELSLNKLKSDDSYDIIELKYFNKMSHERIAEILDCDVKTVTRRKNKIIKRLSFMLFTDDAIRELFESD